MSILQLDLSSKKAKDVSQLLANDTARRIMDAISDDSKSESQIAKELAIPLSTVHYNVSRLTDAGLVTSDEFTYSEKGKEVRHYRLASDHVIITAKPIANLASLLTGLGLTVGVAAVFFVNQTFFGVEQSQMAVMESADSAIAMAPRAAATPVEPAGWLWFLLGGGIMLLGILGWRLVERYR